MLSRKGPIEWFITILIFRGVRWSVLEHTIVEGRHGLHLCSCFVVLEFFPPVLGKVEKGFALDLHIGTLH